MEKRNDAVAQGSVDRCTMATCALYLQEITGVPLRSKSELVRLVFETVKTLAIRSGAKEVVSTADATEILDQVGWGSLNPAHKLRRNLLQNLQNEHGALRGQEIKLNKGDAPIVPTLRRTNKLEKDRKEEYSESLSEAIQLFKEAQERRKREQEEMRAQPGHNPLEQEDSTQ